MSRVKNWTRGAALLALAAAVTACEPDVEIVGNETPAGGAMFRSYVALGNSITAGYQASGINETTQRASFANLFAQQVGTRFAMPIVANPGCPPPMIALGTRPAGTTASTCALRNPNYITEILNNVAVPGAFAIDPAVQQSATSNFLTTLVLGGSTQVDRALQAHPTFASIWIGNNDVLGAATSGIVTPIPGVAPGLTPVANFQAQYDAMIAGLTEGAPELEGALFAVANVTNIPHFIPAAALANPLYVAGLSQIAGTALTVNANCVGSTSLIAFGMLSAIRAGTHHPSISCSKATANPASANPLDRAWGEAYVLDAQDQAAVQAAVTAYNAHIQATATELGWAYVDVNPALAAQRAPGGCVAPYPDLAQLQAGGSGNPFGSCISLDGVHPSTAGHRLIARVMIAAVNDHYDLEIPTIP